MGKHTKTMSTFKTRADLRNVNNPKCFIVVDPKPVNERSVLGATPVSLFDRLLGMLHSSLQLLMLYTIAISALIVSATVWMTVHHDLSFHVEYI